MSAYWKSILKSEHKKTEVQQEARRMKEENYEVVVFQGDPGTIDLTYEEIEAEWNKMLQTVPQIGMFRVIHQEKKRYTFEDYSSQIGNADAALGIWVHKGVINGKLFEAHPNLKYIATLGHGFEDFDVQSDYTKTGYWKEKETNPQASYNQLFVPQIELYQKTMGIIGLGAIGLWTARMAKGFGMKVIANSRHKKTGPQYDGIEQVSMEEIFERSDVISIHCPHTKETENLLNREAFAKMKDGVIIINTARGIIIDEEALLEALESRKVYMAGLDVVANEPPQYQIPLMQSPYTFITSHIAWQPKAARLRAVDLAVKNFRSYLEGMPTSVIN